MKQMKRLTTKEEEIMRIFWEHGPMFVRELLSFYVPTSIMRLFQKRSIKVRHSKKLFPNIIITPISM